MLSLVWINVGRLVATMEAIDRAALVSVQPGSVTAEGDQISERNVGVIPHGCQPRLISRSDARDQVSNIATRSLPLPVLTSLRAFFSERGKHETKLRRLPIFGTASKLASQASAMIKMPSILNLT